MESNIGIFTFETVIIIERKTMIARADITKLENDHPIILNGEGVVVSKTIGKLMKTHGRKYKVLDGIMFDMEELKIIFSNRSPNRDLDCRKVLEMIQDMNNEKWVIESGDSLCFGEDGRLNDGQNRIAAMILFETSFEVSVAINVKKDYIITRKDSGKPRNLKDRATLYNRWCSSPSMKLHPIEKELVACSTVNSVLGKKLNGGVNKVRPESYMAFKDDPIRIAALDFAENLYDETISPIKKSASYWASVARSYRFFEGEERVEDLNRYTLLTFNTMCNIENEYDGWARLARNSIETMLRSNSKSTGTVRDSLYATLNQYLWNYYLKIPCPSSTQSRRITKNLKENFPFPEEEQFVDDQIRIEQEVA